MKRWPWVFSLALHGICLSPPWVLHGSAQPTGTAPLVVVFRPLTPATALTPLPPSSRIPLNPVMHPPTTPRPNIRATTQPITASVADTAPPLQLEDTIEGQILRSYRLALVHQAGLAKSHMSWPGTGQGEITLALHFSPQLPYPLVKLHQSSGEAAWDQRLLQLIEDAVRATPMPEALHQQPGQLMLQLGFGS